MPALDRTNEFRACVESIAKRSALPNRDAEQKQRLLEKQRHDGSGSKSEFARMAGQIGKDISNTTLKLSKLAQCEWCSLAHGTASPPPSADLPQTKRTN